MGNASVVNDFWVDAYIDPDPLPTQVNRALVRDMPAGSFMSLFLGELDTETGRLRYASAGHNAAL